MPFGKLVVKAILPSVVKQVVGFVPKPAVIVGDAGSLKILLLASVLVQPAFVIEKPEKVPSGKPVNSNLPLATVIILGLPEPV